MSWEDDAQKIFRLGSMGFRALEAIGSLAKKELGGGEGTQRLLDALSLIAKVTDSVSAGAAGDKSLQDLEREIDLLRATLDSNDSAARAIRDARFPQE